MKHCPYCNKPLDCEPGEKIPRHTFITDRREWCPASGKVYPVEEVKEKQGESDGIQIRSKRA